MLHQMRAFVEGSAGRPADLQGTSVQPHDVPKRPPRGTLAACRSTTPRSIPRAAGCCSPRVPGPPSLALPRLGSGQQPAAVLTRPIPVHRRGAARRRARQLDHLQRRQRSRRARRLRRGDARLLRGRRADDRFLADVRLVAGRDRLRPAQARQAGAALLGGQGVDLARARAAARRSRNRAATGTCRASISCRCTTCSPGRSTCRRCSR